ncbi:YihY/virulence factor BrkB family protein [Flavobacteriaceae bacterium F08102]|nr:YihY/virulence factor BrkB family protein [Flavobacteriaceae bacterium F08102]
MTVKKRFLKLPIIGWLLSLLQKFKVPGLEGMSVYDVLKMYGIGILQGALTSRASAVAFSFFMALFPFALFILTLIPYVPIEGFQSGFLDFIFQSLPPSTYEAVNSVLTDITNNRYGGLLSFGFILSIFLMTNGVNSLFGGFEYSYHQLLTRTVLKQYFVSLIISLVLALLLFVSVSILIYFGFAIENLKSRGIVSNDIFWLQVGRYGILCAMLYIIVALFYYYGTKEGRKLSFFSPGALWTTLLVIINFKIFSIYIQYFAQYNELYGSIGALLIIMLFIWLNSIILLLGFELNATIIRFKRNLEAPELFDKKVQPIHPAKANLTKDKEA